MTDSVQQMLERMNRDEADLAEFRDGHRSVAAATDRGYQATLAAAKQRAKVITDKVQAAVTEFDRCHVFAQGVKARLNDAVRAVDGPAITRLSKEFDVARCAEDDAQIALDLARRELEQVGIEHW
jgi:hypothetical protein